MNREEFEERYQELTEYLDQCRKDILTEKRKSDPAVIADNQKYSRYITELDANWASVHEGRYDRAVYEKQRQDLLDERENVENNAIREGFNEIKEESLDNWFAGSPDLRKEASERIETDPKYEWIKQPYHQPAIEQDRDQPSIRNDFTHEAGSNIPPIKEAFQEEKGETNEKIEDEQAKEERSNFKDQESQNKLAEAILDTDKFPGYANPSTPEKASETIETKLTPDSFPGYDTQFTVAHDAQPEKGIHYTPNTGGKSDKGPEIDISD